MKSSQKETEYPVPTIKTFKGFQIRTTANGPGHTSLIYMRDEFCGGTMSDLTETGKTSIQKAEIKIVALHEACVLRLAMKFSEVIRRWCIEQEDMPNLIDTIIATNKKNNDNTCATGDFFDSNMAMNEAFEFVMKREFTFFDDEKPETEQQNSDDTDLMNLAWDMAKKSDFFPESSAALIIGVVDSINKNFPDLSPNPDSIQYEWIQTLKKVSSSLNQ